VNTFGLSLLIAAVYAVPVLAVAARFLSDAAPTEHDGDDCRHCAALAVPPGLIGAVSVPRQRGEQA